MADNALAEMLKNKMHQDIPLTQHMGISVTRYQSGELILSAPLEKNINHRLTAFGGSIASLATLSCWGLLFLELHQLELCARVVIQKGNTEYLKPVDHDFSAQCRLEKKDELDRFVKMLKRKGLARVDLSASIFCENNLAATFLGTFVAQQID